MSTDAMNQIREIMSNPENIRNISLISYINQGKSTLKELLTTNAGITKKTNPNHPIISTSLIDEHNHNVTLQSISNYLIYKTLINTKSFLQTKYLIHLIDTPSQIDLAADVLASLRITDGAFIILDCIEGVCLHTEIVLKQALQEKAKPVLMFNKLDISLFELKINPEDLYKNIFKAIEKANSIISIYNDGCMEDTLINPIKGNVVFGSGLMGWAFSLKFFSKIYAKKLGVDEDKILGKLWGEWYFDSECRKWQQNNVSISGKPLKRGFCQFILEPILKLYKSVMQNRNEAINKTLNNLEIILNEEDKQLTGKQLQQKIMQTWLNATDCILNMIVCHIPSPKASQRYKADYLYEGPLDDECAAGIRNCDPDGPLLIYISKMIPYQSFNQLIAFGRVFSGTISEGQEVRIMDLDYIPGKKTGLFIKPIQEIGLIINNSIETVQEVLCGSIIGLIGINQYLVKSGTIANSEAAYPFRHIKNCITPTFKAYFGPTNAVDLPKFVNGVSMLNKIDPAIELCFEDTGEYSITGNSDFHINYCIAKIHDFCGVNVEKKDENVCYRETVLRKSDRICMAKSSNKHSRLFANAEPLGENLTRGIETERVSLKSRFRTPSQLTDELCWEGSDAKRIWCFGPDLNKANLLVDCTKGVYNIEEVRNSLESAFQWTVREGCLCDESMRGIRFNILDALLHTDSVHRGVGQILVAARRVYKSSFLTAKPALQEPIYLAEIHTQTETLEKVCNTLNDKKAIIISEESILGLNLSKLKAYLNTSQSIGLKNELSLVTDCKANLDLIFDHWSTIPDDPLDLTSKSYEIVNRIRNFKGLSEAIPSLDLFLDSMDNK